LFATWQIGKLLANEDTIDVFGSLSVWLDRVRTVRDKVAIGNKGAERIHCWQWKPGRLPISAARL